MKLTKKIIASVLWLGRGTATVMGLAMLLALTVGLASTALAGTGIGARFDLGKINKVNAVRSLVGSVSGPMLALENDRSDRTATALSLQMDNPNLAPMRTNATGKVTNLNADALDGQDASSFADGTNGKANDANNLDGKDSTLYFSGRTYTKDGTFDRGEPGGTATARVSCDPGDVALSGGHEYAVAGPHDSRYIFSERTSGGQYEVTFYDNESFGGDVLKPNVTCADFPPLR